MNTDNKQLRETLRKLPRGRAIEFIKSIGLLPDEEAIIIDCDVNRNSMVHASMSVNCSYGLASLHRKRGYERMLYAINKLNYEI